MHDADRAHRRRLRGGIPRVVGDRQRAQVVRERLRRVAKRVVDLADPAQRVGASHVVMDGLEAGERLAVGLERTGLVERELGRAPLEVPRPGARAGVGDQRRERGRLGGQARRIARVVRERVGRLGEERGEALRLRGRPGGTGRCGAHARVSTRDTSTRQS